MLIEIDQSGKIGDTGVATVLAASNGIRFGILIPAVVKRQCLEDLRKRGLGGTRLYVLLFATALYLLLRDHVDEVSQLMIDIELEGYDASIKDHLINLLRRGGTRIHAETLSFSRLGKESPAHEPALNTYRGEIEPGREIGAEEILSEFR